MRKILAIVIIAAIAVGATVVSAKGAKVRRELRIFNAKVPEMKLLGESDMEFMYDYTWSVDTTVDDAFKTERMILQIAPDMSMFSSYGKIQVDSLLMCSTSDDILANPERYMKGLSESVVKRRSDNTITVTYKICNDWFRFSEPVPDFRWELTGEEKEVLGYLCQGARCTFRGRDFTAWFTDDIPVSDGPWKFCGLPGLILEAGDSAGEYVFKCVGIYSTRRRNMEEYDVSYNRTDRIGYYNTRHSYDINPYSYAQTVSGTTVTCTDEYGNPDPTAFDPMPLDYDYIERDWNGKR